jgi:peptide/nickel transport system substrate-binding protein
VNQFRRLLGFVLIAALLLAGLTACRRRSSSFVIGLSDKFSSLDPVVSKENAAANERVRQLMFNSLIRKDEKFDYIGELATDIQTSPDGLTVTFPLHEGVKFHNGKLLTSADCKYTLTYLLASDSTKKASFFDTVKDAATGQDRQLARIAEIQTPDPKTLVIKLARPVDRQKVISSLVAIGIIPEGSGPQQGTAPVGTGPFKFAQYDRGQMLLDLTANADYWEGAPSIPALRVRVVEDANALQAELKSGRIDLTSLPSNLTPDTIASLAQDPNLQVLKFPGANIVYLGFNTRQPPVDNVKLRQAIAYAINRESIINELLQGQAAIADSILPPGSWAYFADRKYSYDPVRAKQLLDDAGFKDPDGDGPQMRFSQPLEYKVSAGSAATRQYAEVIQSQLKAVGIPVNIVTVDFNTLLDQLPKGQFQMTSSQWIGGNQDPIFLRDIFATGEIPNDKRKGLNRSRYSNTELDKLLDEAMNTADRPQALALYTSAQTILARDLPMIPLWYRANMVIAQKRVGDIKISASGDWDFVRLLTVFK